MIRTPSGMRDLLVSQVRKKHALMDTLLNGFSSYGYEEVMTPSIEYYKTYNQAFSTLEDKQMYKFFDENGEILTLRMDMTVPIARIAASGLKDAKLPLRLSYCADVYKVHKTFAGKRQEVTDCGVELIGAGKDGDLEMVLLALDTMDSLPIDDWMLELGDSRFFLEAAKLVFDEEQIERLGFLIDSKSMVELEEFLNQFDLPDQIRTFFMTLPLLSGDGSVLIEAAKLCFDPSLESILYDLAALADSLKELGYSQRISFDLGKLPHLHYYTGLIFEGFANGASRSVLSGGRYDHLLERFGRKADAVGFSVKIDSLLSALPDPGKPEILTIRYPKGQGLQAFAAARTLRSKQAVRVIEDETLEEMEIVKEVRP